MAASRDDSATGSGDDDVMMAGLSGWHLLILLGVVVLLFGAKRLPDMARAVGQSTRILKSEMKTISVEEDIPGSGPAPAASSTGDQPAKPAGRLPTSREQ